MSVVAGLVAAGHVGRNNFSGEVCMSQRSLVTDARKFSYGWRIWFWILILVNFAGPLFFLQHLLAWLVLGSYVIAGAIIVVLHRKLGWVRLLGVGHILWVALLPLLLFQVVMDYPAEWYGIWLVSVIVVDAVVFCIDIVDVTRYFRGERAPIVPSDESRG